MGWTHDYRDVSRNRRRISRRAASLTTTVPDRTADTVEDDRFGPPLGISRIIGRRARWMTARLRHVRND
ncbi:hypothetical protein GCM10012280_69610 [Wenjunlia tyrosinilytica]|jgi:hypothetical protein|uniref:Uncharacterized protein n=1 Tax=Wenjunlia tyrosinilytica TaxID=1544741 RepID=A0A918A014_9ACTN|nr:hypothetical protein GCM10012280_69610 [Wenjunlia tyrosinilytica]